MSACKQEDVSPGPRLNVSTTGAQAPGAPQDAGARSVCLNNLTSPRNIAASRRSLSEKQLPLQASKRGCQPAWPQTDIAATTPTKRDKNPTTTGIAAHEHIQPPTHDLPTTGIVFSSPPSTVFPAFWQPSNVSPVYTPLFATSFCTAEGVAATVTDGMGGQCRPPFGTRQGWHDVHRAGKGSAH